MKSPCDTVLERVALGEPLGDVAEHAASCESCRRVVALPVELGQVRRDADPGLGFTARMTAGTQQRVATRKRRRLATGLAFAVAASAAGVVVMTHHSEPSVATSKPATQTNPSNPVPTADEPASDEDLQTLLDYADTERSAHLTANWGRIEKPLAPY